MPNRRLSVYPEAIKPEKKKMPRTKQIRKSKSHEDIDSIIRDFERNSSLKIHKMEAEIQMQITSLANVIELAQSQLPTEVRKLTFRELFALEITPKNDADDPNITDDLSSPPSQHGLSTVKGKKKIKRVTAASDDGYATESTSKTSHVSRMDTARNSTLRQGKKLRRSSSTTNLPRPTLMRSSSNLANSGRPMRLTRSSSRNGTAENEPNNRRDMLKPLGRAAGAYEFKTPAAKNQALSFNVVTPKVKPNTPMNILRRPKDGEMVLSMQGSPLLVSSIVQERTANINVPLSNGNVISLLPNAGLRLSHMPALDHETMEQLKTLKGHIDMVLGSP